MVTISTSDNKIFNVEEKVIFQSNLIKDMISDLNLNDQTIPLPNVDSKTMEKILEYIEHHKDDEVIEPKEPQVGERDPTIHDPWDKQFVDVNDETLERIILAANYLDIKNLLTLSCKQVANLIKDKSVEEIREYLDIKKPEEDDENEDENSEETLDNDNEIEKPIN